MTFSQLYTTHKNMVYNLALHYTQNVEDAEEVTQDVFVAAHAKMASFRKESAIKTWLYRITINKSLDFLKAKNRKKRFSFLNARRLDADQGLDLPHFDHPGVQLEQKEATAAIFAAINKLPPNQKTVLILLKIEHLSQAEAAKVMESSTKAVESLFQRAKQNLKKIMASSEGF
ncbi:MAG: RNA polymerase sigma factor [Bacteroidia bacterium]